MVGGRGRMPADVIFGLQQGGEIGVAAGLLRLRPGDPARLERGGQAGEGRRQAGPALASARQVGRRRAAGDHQDPPARLGQEPRRVDLDGPEGVALVGQGLAEGGEVGAAVRGQQADDILDHH